MQHENDNLQSSRVGNGNFSSWLSKFSPVGFNLAHNFHSVGNLSKDSVFSVQPWGGGGANEDFVSRKEREELATKDEEKVIFTSKWQRRRPQIQSMVMTLYQHLSMFSINNSNKCTYIDFHWYLVQH